MLTCKDCGNEFPRNKPTGRPHLYCADCRLDRARAKGRSDQARLRARRGPGWQREVVLSRYGLSTEGYEKILTEQGGGCAICRATEPGGRWDSVHFHVDHDHATGKLRGLLCSNCNVGIGKLGDDVAGLRRALDYLESCV